MDEMVINFDGHPSDVLFSHPDPLIYKLRELDGWGGCHNAEGGYIEDARGRYLPCDEESCSEDSEEDETPDPEGEYRLLLQGDGDDYTLYFTSSEARERAAEMIRQRIQDLEDC